MLIVNDYKKRRLTLCWGAEEERSREELLRGRVFPATAEGGSAGPSLDFWRAMSSSDTTATPRFATPHLEAFIHHITLQCLEGWKEGR